MTQKCKNCGTENKLAEIADGLILCANCEANPKVEYRLMQTPRGYVWHNIFKTWLPENY